MKATKWTVFISAVQSLRMSLRIAIPDPTTLLIYRYY
jgi:hypothetical protein